MAYDSRTSFMDMMGAMFDPIIVFPGGWGDTLPQWLRGEIEIQRMAQVMEGAKADKRPEMATDAEAMAYISTASFVHPLPSEVVNVYLWLGKKVIGKKRYPKDLAKMVPKELRPDELRFLEDLKRWLWAKRLQARAGRGKALKVAGAEDDDGMWEAWSA